MPDIAIETPSASDIDTLHALLAQTYWSPGIPRETVARACAHSLCAIARDANGVLVGFARAITDHATFAWVCDVIVCEGHRGEGLGRDLVRKLRDHPDCAHLRRWMLGTRDAHGVYTALGFAPVAAPARLMEILNPAPYGKPTT